MIIETIIGCVIAAAGYYFYKENKKDNVVPSPTVNTLPFPCVIEGTIDAPPMEDQLKALAIEAESKGIKITGDYEADKAAQGGGMYLVGYSFRFEFDTNGQVVKSTSHANLFGVNYGVEGGVNPDGTLGMDVVVDTARVQVQGKVQNGTFINGKVVKTWLFKEGHPPHIYGVLNGRYTKL